MIRLARPFIGEAELRATQRVLEGGWLSGGPEIAAFERGVCERVGAAHAVAVSSGTAALELALRAAGIGPSDEVIVPAFTYLATLHAVKLVGAEPVIVDVHRESWNIDVEAVQLARTARTRAVMPVDQFGLPADLEALRAACPGLLIIEDAACALGARRGEAWVGQGVPLCCFSFHPRKVITTGEGGMVLTDDEALASRLRQLRNHGRDDQGRFVTVSGNHRLSSWAASLGLVQLGRLEDLVAKRALLAARYHQRLEGDQRLAWQRKPAGVTHTYQTFAVWLSGANASRRSAIIAALAAEGIEAGIATTSASTELPYCKHARCNPGRLPVAHALGESGLALPLHPCLEVEDVDRVCDALEAILAS
ncbi:MAG: DegT/DnrJ/EryC1/StrS family aminotransferase [Deltaproteobacteria bacterium]|nr:DegT/DnrJ/EryC1/StrS family aminotransferase [Deltaproteobacteria bacterium]